MSEFIEASSHPLWLPIALDRTAEDLQESVVDRFGPGSEDVAAAMAGVAHQLREAGGTVADDGMVNLAAWALLVEPEVLDVRAFATLRAIGIVDDITQQEAVDAVIGDATVFQAPQVETFETLSGDATSLRFRPMVDDAEVHEVLAVLWPRPQSHALYVLSTYSTDLVESADIGDLLDELGAGIQGL